MYIVAGINLAWALLMLIEAYTTKDRRWLWFFVFNVSVCVFVVRAIVQAGGG